MSTSPEEWIRESDVRIDAREQESFQLKDFLNLTEEERAALRERIAEHKGLIRIFVHPYQYQGPDDYHDDEMSKEAVEKKLKAIDTAIKRMANLPQEHTPPILFMEGKKRVRELKQRLQEHLEQAAYVIPTNDEGEENSPEPKFDSPGKETAEASSAENWQRFSRMLREAGVKKIIIGGMLFDIEQDPDNPRELNMLHCVGTAVQQFSKDFDVEVSNLTFPKGHREYREAKRNMAA